MRTPSSVQASPRRCGLKRPLAHGKTKSDNLHQHVDRASTLRVSVDGMPHHLCLLRSSLPLCFTFCHLECQLNQLISPGFHFSEEQKDPRLAWQPSRNVALIPPADTASSHEKSPAQRACVFVHTPCLFLLHNSSAAQAGQSLRGPVVRTFL